MNIAKTTEKMIAFYEGALHDINHFVKVHAYARTIGLLEQLDAETRPRWRWPPSSTTSPARSAV